MNSKPTLIGVAFILVVFLFVALFGFGFGMGVPASDPSSLSMGETPGSTKTGEEALKITSSRYETSSVSSSFLPYDASAHFAYDPYLAYDENWKTAWCSAEALPSLTLTFEELTGLRGVGIVPGYAASEELFFNNARWKTVAISYNGSEQVDGVDEVLSFEDRYGMQFFDLNVRDVQSIHFQVLETYPGAKYSDVCLAEVDFWSDFVDAKDEESALTLGMSPSNTSQICEDGRASVPEAAPEVTSVSPTEQTSEGDAYAFPDWGVSFTIAPEFKSYHVYRRVDGYTQGLIFSKTSNPDCLAFGDGMDSYLSIRSEEDFGPSGLPKTPFALGLISGVTIRDPWFGGDILTYAFSFGGTSFYASSMACPLDRPDQNACKEQDEALIRGILSTLH